MKKAKMIVSKVFKFTKISELLFSSFIEHMGNVVYGGIYEPEHLKSDENGFRKDVLEIAQQLNLTAIRYPGGNFVSSYKWEDSVGPKKTRPLRLDLAWHGIEPNAFGLNEFMLWTKKLGVDPIMAINLGTRGVDAARNLIEYCNFPQGSYFSELRRSHGFKEPHKIKIWCLGNELDGKWQIGQKSANEYGLLAREAAKAMKLIDPEIKLVAVGSSMRSLSSFAQWDKTVLMNTYNYIDYISLHSYIMKKDDDTSTYLAKSLDMDKQIKEIIATCDYVKARKRSNKIIYLSFDEWNVAKLDNDNYIPWKTGCPIDRILFSMEDALVFGSMLLTLLKNSDRVKIACQALLVNTQPLIVAQEGGNAWRNTIFYPFLHVSKFGRGEVLINLLNSPKYTNKEYGDVPIIDSVAVFNEEKKEINIFAINRSTEDVLLEIDIKDFKKIHLKEHILLRHENINATNTSEKPLNVFPKKCDYTKIEDNFTECLIKGYSWNVIRFENCK